MPRLSIVIPCLGGAAEFDGTLVSVLQHRPADCEVLVVHTEPYDDPYGLSGEVDFLARQSRSLAGLINAGLGESSGEIVHIVGCGLEATEGWTDAAVARFDEAYVIAVSPIVVLPDENALALGVRFTRGGRRKIVTAPRLPFHGASAQGPSLAAGFYRRDVLAALGGLDESLGDAAADADLALAMPALGGLYVCEPASRLTQAYGLPLAIEASGFAAGRAAERLFWRHASGQRLALSLLLHGFTVAASLAASGASLATIAALVGRAMACLEFGAATRHEQRLDTARQRLEDVAELRATIRIPDWRAATSTGECRRAA